MKITTLHAGGNACALLEQNKKTGEEWVVRVSTTEWERSDMQILMSRVLAPFVPRAEPIYEATLDTLDVLYREAFARMASCHSLYTVWKRRNWHSIQPTLYVSRMEYAYMGALSHFAIRHPLNVTKKTWRRLALFLLIALYVGQLQVRFDHNDLSFANIVITWDARWRVYIPQLIDFDVATVGRNDVDHAKRSMGVIWLRAPEFLNPNWDLASIPGAADMWALGMILLLRELGTYPEREGGPLVSANLAYQYPWGRVVRRVAEALGALPFEDNIAWYYCACAFHALLQHSQNRQDAHISYEDQYPDTKTAEKISTGELAITKRHIFESIADVYGYAISQLDAPRLEFFHRILHWDPRQRLFRGEMYRYFELPYLTEVVPVKLWLERYLRPLTGDGKLRNIEEGPLMKV
jgi:serine/threonine protein kinase